MTNEADDLKRYEFTADLRERLLDPNGWLTFDDLVVLYRREKRTLRWWVKVDRLPKPHLNPSGRPVWLVKEIHAHRASVQ